MYCGTKTKTYCTGCTHIVLHYCITGQFPNSSYPHHKQERSHKDKKNRSHVLSSSKHKSKSVSFLADSSFTSGSPNNSSLWDSKSVSCMHIERHFISLAVLFLPLSGFITLVMDINVGTMLLSLLMNLNLDSRDITGDITLVVFIVVFIYDKLILFTPGIIMFLEFKQVIRVICHLIMYRGNEQIPVIKFCSLLNNYSGFPLVIEEQF